MEILIDLIVGLFRIAWIVVSFKIVMIIAGLMSVFLKQWKQIIKRS